MLLMYAFMFVLALICFAVAVVIALWIMGHMLGGKSEPSAPSAPTWSPGTKEDHEEQHQKSMCEVSFSIRIVNDDGKGVRGIRVYIEYPLGSATDETGDDGWAHFSEVGLNAAIMGDVLLREIRVKGTTIAKDVTVKDGETLSYTLPHTFWG